ncbi:DUF429 domain-containing protein [Roseomonas sp. M0104]|uniref:DUF429 domain-containing protein n=1 Tax=Teichococcus coralli TaxID=2545983 RepID=A0A845BR64_9PROT|nr:DUF429 domain-containing protein [Pseudoroseomonas coralli]MXP65879.1 DUF429 domain-containing protein [Pseudoroseomonas coralli]
MFDQLIHADWSVSPRKRWAATAVRQAGHWVVKAPALVGPAEAFLDRAFAAAARQRVLLGFDFPIGVPAAYGARTGLRSFRELLPLLRAGFLPGQCKRRQADRQEKAAAISAWAEGHGVVFAAPAADALAAGFGSSASGEDQFDALLGLLKMIEVAEGRRAEATERHDGTAAWEGWILGR